jgi:hypothetical protein
VKAVLTSIEDFFMAVDGYGEVFLDTISLNIVRRPIGNDPQKALKFEVFFNISTLMQGKEADGEPYQILLEFAANCGFDFEDSPSEMAGSEKAKGLKSKVEEYAAKSQLRILPGILGY